VNPNGTSQHCSRCGKLVPKTLSQRWYICPFCGLKIHRNYNSAKLILKLGIGKELPQYTPVEIRPLLGNEQAMVGEAGSHL